MNKNLFRAIAVFAVLAALTLQSGCSPFQAPNDPEQVDKAFAELVDRLKNAGVPLVDAQVKSYTPVVLSFLIQSLSSEKQIPAADLWNQALVEREATLAYQFGLKVSEYSIGFVDPSGKVFAQATAYLYDTDSSQRLSSVKQESLNDKSAQDSLIGSFDVRGLAVERVSVASVGTALSLGQLAEMDLVVEDVKQAVDLAPTIVLGTRMTIDKVNQSPDIHIGVMHLTISEKSGIRLVDYIYDADTGSEFVYKAPQIPSWFPEPEATQTALPNSALTQIVKPTVPAPVSTPAPYPGRDDQTLPIQGPNRGYP